MDRYCRRNVTSIILQTPTEDKVRIYALTKQMSMIIANTIQIDTSSLYSSCFIFFSKF
jgi:hypothetical protein